MTSRFIKSLWPCLMGAVLGSVQAQTVSFGEAWTRVISAAQGAEDPALSALGAILKSRLVPAKATFTLIRRR